MAPPAIAYTLPTMQLVCNLVILGGAPTPNNTNPVISGNETTTQIPIPSITIPENYVPHLGIGLAYGVYKANVTWKIARQECINAGARLAVIDNFIKYEYLINQTSLVNAIHVGIHRMYDDTEWVSATTGDTVTSVPFAAGYPNGASDCVIAGYSPRGLRNVACSTKAFYACEIPISKNYSADELLDV